MRILRYEIYESCKCKTRTEFFSGIEAETAARTAGERRVQVGIKSRKNRAADAKSRCLLCRRRGRWLAGSPARGWK